MIISFLLFAATLIVYFNLIVPANDDEQEVKAQVISRQEFIDSQKAAISQVQKLINSYKGEGDFQNAVSSILPSFPDLAGAFSQISGLIQINKILMQSMAVGTATNHEDSTSGAKDKQFQQIAAKPYSSVDFQFRMVGTYENFKSFMKNLETNIRIFDVKRIDMQPSGKPNQDVYIYDLTVSAYYQNPS